MSEGGDFDEGEWRGNDFSKSRDEYRDIAKQSLPRAIAENKTISDVRLTSVTTMSPAPLIVITDETASMDEWPTTIFSKLGYLELEGQTYLGKEMEISFAAVGDALNGERYPLQIRQFVKGLRLRDELGKLIHENKGGGNGGESYDLAALYYLENCSAPSATRKPIMIFIADEPPHSPTDIKMAEAVAGVKLVKRMTAEEIFAKLQDKFSVYMILKPYNLGAGENDPVNSMVYKRWVQLLGTERVKPLPEAERVVDVIFGILAEDTGRNDLFRQDMEKRQTPAQRAVVYKALGLNPDGTPKNQQKSDEKKDEVDEGEGSKSVLKNPGKKPGWLL